MNHKIHKAVITATGAAAALMAGHAAHASTVVATIIGAYDPSGCDGTSNPCGTLNGTTLKFFATNGGNSEDTPTLFIENPNNVAMTSVTLTLTGYQDYAGGGTGATFQSTPAGTPLTKTVTISGGIAANTVYELRWTEGFATTGDLFTYDYDDSASFAAAGTTDSLGHTCGTGSGTLTYLCGYVGNFNVLFSANLGSAANPIAANFSPDNTQLGGHGNVAGTFVGWEGLDADGLSETKADAHTLTFPGTLAVITTGTAGTQPTPTPEPGTLAMLGIGLGALGLTRRRRKS